MFNYKSVCAIINTQEKEKRSYSHSMSGKLDVLSMFISTQVSKFEKTSDVLSLICKNDLNCKKSLLGYSFIFLERYFNVNFSHDRIS